MPAQLVRESGDLVDVPFAMVAEQTNLHSGLIEERAGKAIDALSEDRSGDRAGVDLVRLAGLALPATGQAHELRRDPDDTLPRGHERTLEMVGYVPAVLQCPHHIRVELPRPLQRLTMRSVVSGDLTLAYDLAGPGVDGSERVRALVGIRSDHNHLLGPFVGGNECGPPADRSELGRLPRSY